MAFDLKQEVRRELFLRSLNQRNLFIVYETWVLINQNSFSCWTGSSVNKFSLSAQFVATSGVFATGKTCFHDVPPFKSGKNMALIEQTMFSFIRTRRYFKQEITLTVKVHFPSPLKSYSRGLLVKVGNFIRLGLLRSINFYLLARSEGQTRVEEGNWMRMSWSNFLDLALMIDLN